MNIYEEHEKALNLALNKISGEWDYDKLSTVMEDLKISHFDLDLTGFDFCEIKQITLPQELGLQFNEIEQIKEGELPPVTTQQQPI